MCQVIRVKDLVETMEDFFDDPYDATVPTQVSSFLDKLVASDDWLGDERKAENSLVGTM